MNNVQSAQAPGTLSQLQRISAHSDLQSIPADYYNITTVDGAPVAGLVILMDRKQRPVRAELHLHDTTLGPLQDLAQRQAYLLIQDRYTGDQSLPLNVLRAHLEDARISVPLPPPPPPSGLPSWAKPVMIGWLAFLLFGAMGWYLNDLITRNVASIPDTAPPITNPAVLEPAAPATDQEQSQAPIPDPATVRISETNNLPVSQNALPLDINQRVRIRPGYQVALRTEPGATAGEVIGAIQGGTVATIVNGPVWMEGNNDTIVWWYIRLEDGTEAWVAANTSDLTLLEPAP
jgi:hypothetical protein